MEDILEFKDIGYFYKNGNKTTTILDGVNYKFSKGTLYTILGPSGSGKTTALSLAAALESPKSGAILYKDKNINDIGLTKYRKMIGMVFQSYNLINYMNARQNVIMTMEISGSEKKEKKEKAEKLLETVGLSKDMIKRNINKLSGGEQQRVAIARALASDAELILADEPTGNLDVVTTQGIIDVFKKLAHEMDKCVIVVTHSQEFAKNADVVISLKDNKLITTELPDEENVNEQEDSVEEQEENTVEAEKE